MREGKSDKPNDAAKCGADLHTCSNCIHFDTSVHWECRKNAEIPARIPKKRDRNDCALFTPKLAQEFARKYPAAAAQFRPSSLADIERQHILATLMATGWNKSQAANLLGIERSTLDRKIRRYDLVEAPRKATS